MLSHPPDNDIVCPNCGNYADELDEYTGWCRTCSYVPTNRDTLEISFAANADAIEFYISTGRQFGKTRALSVWKALKLAQADRAICVVCGNRIARASRSAIFCRKTPECRRYSRRYVYLYREKGLTKVEALAIVLEELT